MFLWPIRLLLISTVIGFRLYNFYKYFTSQYGYEQELCPDLHTHVFDMHPHKCVSYASICQGVTEIEVKIAVNGSQYLCHPRFQPWGAGSPQKDLYAIHCGYDGGDQLVMEMLSDGHYKYYCKSFTDDINRRCLITALQQGLYRCQFCKYPFLGYLCKFKDSTDFDERYTNPPILCKAIYCAECDQLEACSKCPYGYSLIGAHCSFCDGFTSCIWNGTHNIYNQECIDGFSLRDNKCMYCMQCKSCVNTSCDSCYNYQFRVLKYWGSQEEYACAYDVSSACDFSRQSISEPYLPINTINTELKYYNITCSLCDPGYFPVSNGCELVSAKFKNCFMLNLNGDTCQACLKQYALHSDGTCQLMQLGGSSNCQTFLDINPQFCTTCDATKILIQESGICICKPTYGFQVDICIPCTDGFCQECDQSDFYSCISCKPGSNRILMDQRCICQPGSYDPENEDQICIICDQSCPTCFGPSNQECIECLDESISNRIQIGDSCPCKTGYAEYEIIESKCGKCHPRCNTCFQAADETTNQYCLTCKPGQNRVVSDNFNCNCLENYGDYYGTKDVCFVCDYTCGTCDDFGPTHCIECLESSNRYLTSSGECICKTSYFDDETDNIECSKCHYSCILCANSIQKDACQQCPLTREPSDPLATQFECNCSSSNLFDDGFSQECLQCDYTCQTCNGPLSSNCLTCDSTYRQLDLSSCVCLNGYYDIGQLQCEKCHYSCHQCFDNTVEGCIACSLDLHQRVQKGNICKCIDGYYEEPGIALCKQCSYKCQTCETQSEQCLSCPLNSLRVLDSIKGCYCLGEYYEKENEIACQKCHFKCKSCNGQNENNCLSCDSVANRELKGNECKCQIHYFEMEVQECTICSAFCYECINNFENCTSCNNDRFLVGSTCKCITKFNGAAISTFDYNGMVKCQKCHHSCGTCGGIEELDCINCIDTDHRYQIGTTCLCNEGYYDAGLPVCEKCSYKCKGCQKQSESCVSCPDNSFRQFVSGFNRCQCIQRYYDDGQNEVCQKCHYSCLRCNDIETKCELCSIESNRIYNDQLFTCDCNIGYYDIGIENCQKCHYSCLSCNSGDFNSCISCVPMNNSNRVLCKTLLFWI
ncbi:unnamed protein product [Paramecium primaurelia]|uniref:EGF-like domain-containing protein n=1 Tax=Paramecium primaurelia TaxID=5886 RepID=A0A8S1M786_PARPR|nr:unnamed protein product [Paramecium primaurelia]